MSNNQINIIRFGSISRMKILNISRNIIYGVFNALDLGPCDEFVTIVDNNRDMFEFECNTCICLEIFDISRESLEDELLVPYISPTGSCPDNIRPANNDEIYRLGQC
jgi:hypothetical protein